MPSTWFWFRRHLDEREGEMRLENSAMVLLRRGD